MKHNYLILVALFLFSFTQAQIVNIPDANFKLKLTSETVADLDGDGSLDGDVDTNNDGEIQVSEAESVYRLRIFVGEISSVEGIASFVNITNLDIQYTDITELDLTNNTSLLVLNCGHNQLTTLNVSGLGNLIRIRCDYNNLSTVDLSGLSNLTEFFCTYNQMTSLDFTTSPNLFFIECQNNLLSTLNITGLNVLDHVRCQNNQLSELNLSGLVALEYLDCSNNQISNLNFSDLNMIRQLYCNNNQLNGELVVPNLTSLQNLACQNNLLSSLTFESDLPVMSTLECGNNQLVSLDIQKCTNLDILFCENNNLQELFLKNGSLMYDYNMNFSNNFNLSYVCVDDMELNDIETLLSSYNYMDVILNTYCSFVPGGEFYTIQGANKLDLDVDGCDINDSVLPNLRYNITNGSITGTIISNTTGSYSIPVQAGTHTITPILENPTYFTVAPPNLVVDFPTATSPYDQDFCITTNGSYNDLEIVLVPRSQLRQGFEADYSLIYKNNGTTTLSGNIDFNFDTPFFSLISSMPNIDSETTGTINWNYTDLMPFESREIIFTMHFNGPVTEVPPIEAGEYFDFIVSINPIAGDETEENNTFVLEQVVVNSFDPNDKTCLQGETIELEEVGKYIHYLIRFENIGTANAVNIVVKDEIDLAKYDVSTLIPLNSSHDFVTRIKDDNIVEFIFEDINLPFDDANNDGYVLLKIKTLETLELGDTFSNDAEIYFDYNTPIITNDELTTVVENLSVEETELQSLVKIYPNPTNDYVFIESNDTLESIAIYDIHGRQIQILVLTGTTNSSKIDLSYLSKGVYFLNMKTKVGEQTSKIIKK